MRRLRRILEAAPLAVLAAACVWMLRDAPSRAPAAERRAAEQASRIVAAIERLWSDVGRERLREEWPPDIDLLAGPGVRPRGLTVPAGDLADLLLRDGFGLPDWGGPYLDRLDPDPWGRSFVVTTRALAGGARRAMRLFVVSAGPNGRVETFAHDVVVHGDDVARVVRPAAEAAVAVAEPGPR